MICTVLTFFCFVWQISPSLSACAQASVSVSFGSPNASFLRVKEATERQIILPRMRKNSPFRCQKSKNFLGRGHSPLPRPHPRWGGGTPPHTPPPSAPSAPRFSRLRRSTSAPSAPRSSRLRRSNSAPSAPRSSHFCNDKYYLF